MSKQQFTYVSSPGAKQVVAELHKRFRREIDGTRFDFMVTRVLGFPLTVTHKQTGMRVCDVSVTALQASGDMKYAATVALDDLIALRGGERVARVIRQAVQEKQGLLAE